MLSIESEKGGCAVEGLQAAALGGEVLTDRDRLAVRRQGSSVECRDSKVVKAHGL